MKNKHPGEHSAADANWIPLMDYSVRHRVSVSTLRRYIKANKIRYRVENGRYLLWDDQPGVAPSLDQSRSWSGPDPEAYQALQAKVHKLEKELRRSQEEVAELKMLIALYEEKLSKERLQGG